MGAGEGAAAAGAAGTCAGVSYAHRIDNPGTSRPMHTIQVLSLVFYRARVGSGPLHAIPWTGPSTLAVLTGAAKDSNASGSTCPCVAAVIQQRSVHSIIP